jgi:hypothetical protein
MATLLVAIVCRNGIVMGARIRLPYVIQAFVYALLYRESRFVLSHQRVVHNESACVCVCVSASVVTCANVCVIIITIGGGMCTLFLSYRNRLVFTMKQLVQHGKNLGMFVGIYKAICYILRRMGVDGGLECWIAG